MRLGATWQVLVFSFSVLAFCHLQATQCFSYQKAAGVAIVATGLLVYALSTARASRAASTMS